MDPLSVIGTVAAVTTGVYTCVTSLYNFIQNATVVDETVTSLYRETHSLQRMVNAIAKALESPSVRQQERLPLWEDCNAYLQECHNTVQVLEITLVDLQQPNRQGRNFFKDAYKQWRLDMKDDEIKRLRDQMHSHAMALQVTLQTINVHLASTAPEVIIEELNPHLQELLRLVRDVHGNMVLPINTGDESLDKKHIRLREAAKAVASHATVIIGSRSTVWDGSEPDLSRVRRTSNIVSETSGSEFGEPLRAEQRDNISSWMRHTSFTPLGVLKESDSRIGSNESRTTSYTSGSGASTLPTSIEDNASDDDEIELEIMQKLLAIGRQKQKDGRYSQAESSLRKALTKAKGLGQKAADVDQAQVTLEIAQASFQQEKYDYVELLCESITQGKVADDSARARSLEASHLLGQVCLAKGDYENALRHSKQSLTGRKRSADKSHAYHESIALIAAIYEAKNHEWEAMAFAEMLPEGFQRPEFKIGHALPSRATTPTPTPTSPIPLSLQPASPKMEADRRRSSSTSPLTEQALHAIDAASKPSRVSGVQHADSGIQELMPPESLVVPCISRQASQRTLRTPSPLPALSSKQTMAIPVIEGPNEQIGYVYRPYKPLHMKAGFERLAIDEHLQLESSDEMNSPQKLETGSHTANTTPRLPPRAPPPPPSLPARPMRREKTPELPKPPKTTLPQIPKYTNTYATSLTKAEQDEAVNTLTFEYKDPLGRAFSPEDTLLWAARRGDRGVVRLCLQPWTHEIRKKTFGITKKETVIRKAAPVDFVDTRWSCSALHLAACSGDDTLCQILLERGASTRLRVACKTRCTTPGCQMGHTALELAIWKGHNGVVKVFAARGALSVKGPSNFTPLHLAAGLGHYETVLLLLAGKADPTVKDCQGATPLHAAASSGHERITQVLIEYGAQVDASDSLGQTALHRAVFSGHLDCTKTLLRNGANITLNDRRKLTSLHIAAIQGHGHVFHDLVDHGADLEARDIIGAVPLHCAVAMNRKDFVEKLLEAGADLHVKDNLGYTALHWAAKFGNEELMTFLKNRGLDNDALTTQSKSPLMLAAKYGQVLTVQLLLLDQVKVNATDKDGHNAFWYAAMGKQSEIARMLHQHGAELCETMDVQALLSQDPYEDATFRMPLQAPWASGLTPPLPQLPPSAPQQPSWDILVAEEPVYPTYSHKAWNPSHQINSIGGYQNGGLEANSHIGYNNGGMVHPAGQQYAFVSPAPPVNNAIEPRTTSHATYANGGMNGGMLAPPAADVNANYFRGSPAMYLNGGMQAAPYNADAYAPGLGAVQEESTVTYQANVH